jgi:hypothetical protein
MRLALSRMVGSLGNLRSNGGECIASDSHLQPLPAPSRGRSRARDQLRHQHRVVAASSGKPLRRDQPGRIATQLNF